MKNTISRRDFVKFVAGATGAVAVAPYLSGCVAPVAAPAATTAGEAAATAPQVLMGTVIRTLANEYHAAWFKGGQMFADSVGMGAGHRGLHCEGDSEKQITLMRALIQEGGSNVVFNIDPNQSPDARAIADLCAENKVYFLTAVLAYLLRHVDPDSRFASDLRTTMGKFPSVLGWTPENTRGFVEAGWTERLWSIH